jgi:hypothetical protein
MKILFIELDSLEIFLPVKTSIKWPKTIMMAIKRQRYLVHSTTFRASLAELSSDPRTFILEFIDFIEVGSNIFGGWIFHEHLNYLACLQIDL